MQIDVQDLVFSYGGADVLQGVSFCADKGERIAVLGPNGVGKSTLFRCLLGFLEPKRGCVKIAGRDVQAYSRRALAAELAERFPEAAARPAAVGCDLGETGEYVKIATLGELAEDAAAARPLSVLALLPGPQRPELPLGLPDEAYRHHKNMITHPEVRAVVLAKLRLAPGVLWDIGAGSGSVGLEAAELCPGLEVHAVEKDAERFADLEANRAAAGVPGHHAHCGGFLEVEPLLPSPDRIFAGGGGAELPVILRTAFSRLKPGGVLAATGVLVETVAVLSTELAEYRTELVMLNLSRALPLGSQEYFKAENPIAIAVYRKPENP